MSRFLGAIFPATVKRPATDGSGTLQTIYTNLPVQIDDADGGGSAGNLGSAPIRHCTAMVMATAAQSSTFLTDLRIGDQITDPTTTDPITGQPTLWLVGFDQGRYPTHRELDVYTLDMPPLPLLQWHSALIPLPDGSNWCTLGNYDATGGRCVDPDCLVCFGRGAQGGYAAATPLYGVFLPGASVTTRDQSGYFTSQDGVELYLPVSAPALKADDLVAVSPDPMSYPGNPDRRYVVGYTITPLHVYGQILARRYELHAAELGTVPYRVPPANSTARPAGQWGTT